MPLEATVICIDNSEYTRNGDYTPNRAEALSDAVNLLCNARTGAHPENTVGLVTLAGVRPEVLVTLTTDLGKLLTALHEVKLGGVIDFTTGIQVAQLILKHRQNKHQHQRIIIFVSSPISNRVEELQDLGKRLKKNNVAVDVVSFGEERANEAKLQAFIEAVKNNENSHLITVPPGPSILSDILVTTPIFFTEESGGGGGGGEEGAAAGGAGAGLGALGVDPNLDPELAEALRLSLQEDQERKRKEEQEKKAAETGNKPATITTSTPSKDVAMQDVDADLEEAIRLSMQVEPQQQQQQQTPKPAAGSSSSEKPPVFTPATTQDISTPSAPTKKPPSELSEEEQLRLAMEMSMSEEPGKASSSSSATTQQTGSTSSTQTEKKSETENMDVDTLMNNPAFLSNLLQGLPGVDPNDPSLKALIGNLDKDKKDEKKEDKNSGSSGKK